MTSPAPGRVRIEAAISTPDGPPTLWFDVPEGALPSSALGDPFALGLVIPAMRLGRDLVVEDVVSEGLLENIREFQKIQAMWFPEFSRVGVESRGTESSSARAEGVGLFFSGGVDSFYSLITREPSHLIYVDMLDTFDEDPSLRARIRSSIQHVAANTSTRLLTVSTNLRAILDRHSKWGLHSHSPALGAIAHSLAAVLGSCIITGDRTYDRLIPFGAHPLTIPRFGSDRLPITTCGWDIWRIDRVKVITDSDLAMQHLRVCWENRESAYNCGHCQKCLRTMAELTVWDALERCETFPDTLDLEELRALELSSPHFLDYFTPTMTRAREKRKDELAAAVEEIVGRTTTLLAIEKAVGAFDAYEPEPDQLETLVEHHHEALYGALSRYKGRWLIERALRELPRRVLGRLRWMARRIARRLRR